MKTVYFDNAASTVVRKESAEAAYRAMVEDYGNPSSTHMPGRKAAAVLASARESVGLALGAAPDEIYFTSGGTESCNWAVSRAASSLSRKGRHVISSSIEHDAVAEPLKALADGGWDVTYLAPDTTGSIPASAFAAALRDDTVFASIMLVNNETGAVNPIGEYADALRKRKSSALLHVDAVQGLCKIPFTVKSLGADLVSVSGHKIHGPKGVGALYIKSGVNLPALILGGGHERGKRSGTEPMPAIAGFGAAARLGAAEREETASHVRAVREYIVHAVASELPDAVAIGENCSPFILSLSLPGHRSEVLMSFLEGEGVYVSKSAACKKGARSRALEAMGLKNPVIDGAIRLSFSKYSTVEEADIFVKALKRASARLLTAP